MNDLVWILGQLAAVDGKILIDGISNQVAPLKEEERVLYETIDFSMVLGKLTISAQESF